jgi:peptidoglycan/LPS O-acetylase OafA/YrhL
MEQSRRRYLDAMRGLAALIVVIVHYFAAFRPYSVFGDLAGYHSQSTWELLCHIPPMSLLLNGHMAVCFFFVLSGYVLSVSHFQKEQNNAVLISAALKRPFRLGGVVLFTVLSSMLIWSRDWYFHLDAAALSGSHASLGGFWTEPFSWRSALFDTITGLFR